MDVKAPVIAAFEIIAVILSRQFPVIRRKVIFAMPRRIIAAAGPQRPKFVIETTGLIGGNFRFPPAEPLPGFVEVAS